MPCKLAAKRADKEADAIFTSLKKASEAAIATTLNAITEKLRGDTALMYHVSALLANEEWTGVLKASSGGEDPQTTSGDKPAEPVKKRLRQGAKKFVHLTRHGKLVIHIRETPLGFCLSKFSVVEFSVVEFLVVEFFPSKSCPSNFVFIGSL